MSLQYPHQKPGVTDTELMLGGYGYLTSKFYYRIPGYLNVLNVYIWQTLDLAPDYPRLFAFIEFWQKEILGPLHSVQFSHTKLIGPREWLNVRGEFPIPIPKPKGDTYEGS